MTTDNDKANKVAPDPRHTSHDDPVKRAEKRLRETDSHAHVHITLPKRADLAGQIDVLGTGEEAIKRMGAAIEEILHEVLEKEISPQLFSAVNFTIYHFMVKCMGLARKEAEEVKRANDSCAVKKAGTLSSTLRRDFAALDYSYDTALVINHELDTLTGLADSALWWSEGLSRNPQLQKEAIACVRTALEERMITFNGVEHQRKQEPDEVLHLDTSAATFTRAILETAHDCFSTHNSILEAARCLLCSAVSANYSHAEPYDTRRHRAEERVPHQQP